MKASFPPQKHIYFVEKKHDPVSILSMTSIFPLLYET